MLAYATSDTAISPNMPWREPAIDGYRLMERALPRNLYWALTRNAAIHGRLKLMALPHGITEI